MRKFSVSLINSFYSMILEKKSNFGTVLVNEKKLIDMIKRISVTVPRMTFGTAFHSILECPLNYTNDFGFQYPYKTNEKTFLYNYDFLAYDLFTKNYNRNEVNFEVPELFDFDGNIISMRIDGLMPNKILEFKTEFSFMANGVDVSKYIDSLQHQIYMLAMELYNADYLVWQFEAKNLTDYAVSNLFTLKKSPIYSIDFDLKNFEIIPTKYNTNFENTLKYILNELNDFIDVMNLGSFVEYSK